MSLRPSPGRTEQRNGHRCNRLTRWLWPTPIAVVLAQRVLPLVYASIMVNVAVQGAPVELLGIGQPVHTELLTGLCAAGTTLAALQPARFAPLGVYAVTLALLGLAVTLLFVGSPILNRSSELVASSLYGGAWLAYVCALWNAAMAEQLAWARAEARRRVSSD